jgi:hypothetical protein
VDFRTLGAILATVAAKRKGLTKMPKGPIRSTLIASRVIALLALSSVLLPLGVQARRMAAPLPRGRGAASTLSWRFQREALKQSSIVHMAKLRSP